MNGTHLKNSKVYSVCLLIGLSSGLTVSLFLICLQWITETRHSFPLLIWGLPIVGLLIPYLYKNFGFGSEKGMKLILEEIHKPQQLAPLKMAPLIFITTVLTHLVGGSAGREGTALQMSATLADRIGTYLKVTFKNRRWILIAGLSSGFSAALGAPWAGMLFGMEVIVVGNFEIRVLIECFLASFTAWTISVLMKAPHFIPLQIGPPDFSFNLFLHLIMLAVFLGLISRLHVEGIKRLESVFNIILPKFKASFGGLILLLLYLKFPLSTYQGLGLDSISLAFSTAPTVWTPLIKLLLTALTLAAGFKGGEFVPLVFIGTTTASVLAHHWHEPLAFFSALGFVSLFGAAAKTPWTCAVLAIELFGLEIAPYAFFITLASYATAGPFGIYPGQRILERRTRKL